MTDPNEPTSNRYQPMLTVRRNRQFMCAGHYWTIWIECRGTPRGMRAELPVEWREFWQWLTDHITALPSDTGDVLVPQYGGALQTIGEDIERHPEDFTAERMAVTLLVVFHDISSLVSGVTVLRSLAAGHADNTVEATARSHDGEAMTVTQARDAFRHFARQNRLVCEASDTWPREL